MFPTVRSVELTPSFQLLDFPWTQISSRNPRNPCNEDPSASLSANLFVERGVSSRLDSKVRILVGIDLMSNAENFRRKGRSL